MTLDWQQIAALSLVALASGYLALRGWRLLFVRVRASCGGCAKCAARPNDDAPVLTQLAERQST
jgi:hypothetical protein